MGEFLQVVNYQEAVTRLSDNFPTRLVGNIPLSTACGQVLAQPIVSPEDMPAFNRSTVDGYALAASDSFGASESLPAFLQQVGEIQMGKAANLEIRPGTCVWMPTGGMLPKASDAVIMVEYTEHMGEDTILIYRPAGPGENVMLQGEDIRQGQVLYQPGHVLRSQDIGLLASLGIQTLSAYRPYKIGIISTGDEVIPIEAVLQPGQVRDVNTYALAAAIQTLGHQPVCYPLVRDNRDRLQQSVSQALEENDIVLMSGGSSVGIADMTMEVLLSFQGAQLLFHGVAAKPGKPTLGIRIDSKVVVGLPGHPVSAIMMFHVLLAPLLRGSKPFAFPAVASQNIASQAGRDDFIPVQLVEHNGRYTAQPLLGKSGLMGILARADGYIHIPYTQQGILAGQDCQVWLFNTGV